MNPSNDGTSAPSTFTFLHLASEEAKESGYWKPDVQEDLIRKGAREMVMLKVTLIILLFFTAIIVAALTYVSFHEAEKDEYQSQFLESSTKIINQFLEETQVKFWTCYSLSVAFTTEFEMNSTWPNATLPRFQIRNFGTTSLARSSAIAFSPLVTEENKESWESYAVQNENLLWWDDSMRYLAEIDASDRKYRRQDQIAAINLSYQKDRHQDQMQQQIRHIKSNHIIANGIYRIKDGAAVGDAGPGPYLPIWQVYPPTTANKDSVMYNQMSDATRARGLSAMFKTKRPVITEVLSHDSEESRGTLYYPVFDGFDDGPRVVGTTSVEFTWEDTFRQVLPADSKAIICVLENSYGQQYSYRIEGEDVYYLGEGDLHDSKFDDMEELSTFDDFLQIYQADMMFETNSSLEDDNNIFTGEGSNRRSGEGSNRRRTQQEPCLYSVRLYPTQEFWNEYMTSKPILYSVTTIAIVAFLSVVFMIFECLARRRQGVVMETLARSSAIVHSLFPATVRDRMLHDAEAKIKAKRGRRSLMTDGLERENSMSGDSLGSPIKLKLGSFLKGSRDSYLKMENAEQTSTAEPIADFFPHTTCMFADIAGFTAWSSDREPSEVFHLLETVWAAFDATAKRLGVYKIETVGDCYVCVTGLPDANEDHAVIMTRFAYECLHRFKELTQKLEVSLGPGTTDLAMRFGLHSGPVTAGVLRGEKARFQLFGDTMNTAARMESTGQKNRIHISQATAALLVEAGKDYWFVPREKLVTAKGKGEMQTYWINTRRMPNEGEGEKRGRRRTSRMMDAVERYVTQTLPNTEYECQRSGGKSEGLGGCISKCSRTWDSIDSPFSASKNCRLVDWNVDVLLGLLGKVVKKRANVIPIYTGGCILEEFVETNGTDMGRTFRLRIDEKVKLELHDFVTRIASLYRDVPYHNFEHASHVAMTANNLMKRIRDTGKARKSTFGISSDPLSHFAVFFSALIHDVDRRGFLSAPSVVKEQNGDDKKDAMSEQTIVELTWELLIEPRYKNLRSCIYADAYERDRFRQLLTNCVVAMDVTDMELRAVRKKRWHAAFSASSPTLLTPEEVNSRKATIVIELIMQMSSAAHYAQHWLMYRKWNERLFTELYQAYKNGRSDRDPSKGWYEKEILFFDIHVIPLAKMIKVCGVFAKSNDECLTYALQNRREWEMEGQELCREMLTKGVEMEKGSDKQAHALTLSPGLLV